MSLNKEIQESNINKLSDLTKELSDVSQEIGSTIITLCNGKAGHDQMEYLLAASTRLGETLNSESIDLNTIGKSVDLLKDVASVAEVSKYSSNEETYAKIDKIIEDVMHLEDNYKKEYNLSNNNIGSVASMKP